MKVFVKEKAVLPIEVIVDGIIIEVSCARKSFIKNIDSPITVRPEVNITFDSDVHWLKAAVPIDITNHQNERLILNDNTNQLN